MRSKNHRVRFKRLMGPNVAVSQIREARLLPYDFAAIGQDDAAPLAIEAAAIERCDDYSPKAVASMLRLAALAVGRANRHARFSQRRLEVATKKRPRR